MSEKVIRQILLQARDKPHGKDNGGWTAIRIRGVGDSEVSLYVEEANNRGLLKAVDVSSFDFPHAWKVVDITASGLQFLSDSKPSKKLRLFLWSAIVLLVAFLAWLIPVLISLLKK